MFFREIINAEVPKRPVNSGSKGFCIGRFRVRNPRKPARINIVREIRNSSSLRIK